MSNPETDLVKDWQTRNPVGQWRRVRDRQLCGPAREFCRDVAEELQREAADVGPQLDDQTNGASGGSWAGSSGPPLVLVGLSSTVMRQEGLLQRAADALGQLPARGLVTTGPAVDPAVISAPDNVTVTRWVRHADVLPHCSAVITHGGHGTVMKALIAGVPLVLVPLGRDQPDNAGRVVHADAGIRLRKNASASALRTAIGRVIEDPRYRAAAQRMAARLASEREDNRAVDELEQVAACGPAAGHPAPGEADSG
jgi:MGT family glycosyltransferase